MPRHMTPLTGVLHRLRRGRSLVGCAIDSERLVAIEHGHVLPTVAELRRIGLALGLTSMEAEELRQARHRALFAEVHRQGRRRAS